MHQLRRPTPDCRVVEPMAAAHTLRARLSAIHRARGCGAYLYVDSDRNAYVLSEDRTIAAHWVTAHFDWLVGLYAVGRKVALSPTVEGLAEDLADHLEQLHSRQCRAA